MDVGLKDIVKLKNRIDIQKWLDEMGVKWYSISDELHPDGYVIHVQGNVDLSYKNLEKIPYPFGDVFGKFDCGFNKLTSLENSPWYVSGSFWCNGNKLTSLEGAMVTPGVIGNNPCEDIYRRLGFTTEAHKQCRKVWI